MPLDYLAAGVRDELIAELARLGPDRLTVIARESSARLASSSHEQMTRRLGADYLLRGSVTRQQTGTRVALQLIDAGDGRVLWADTFDEPGAGSALPRRAATLVAEALAVRVTPDAAVAPRDPDPRVWERYRKAEYLLGAGSWRQFWDGVDLLREALAIDTAYAPALVSLGKALLRVGDSTGRWHLDRAVMIDSGVPGAHVALGDDDLYRRWDVDGARRHYARALRLHPGAVETHHRYAYFLSLLGRHEEALAEIGIALRLDPVSPLVTGDVGRLHYRAGRYEDGERYCRESLQLVRTNAAARACLLNLRLVRGDLDGARRQLPGLLDAYGGPAALRDSLASLPSREAVDRYWSWRADALETRSARDENALVPLAQAYVWLGRHDDALTALEMAVERRSTALPLVAGDPCFAPLFRKPRYRAVFVSAGLPLTPPPVSPPGRG